MLLFFFCLKEEELKGTLFMNEEKRKDKKGRGRKPCG